MTTLKLTVAYKGTFFNGWQYQPKGRTVQGVLEKVISQTLGETIKVLGSSRTDAGVHAYGQVVCVQYACSLAADNFRYVINRRLPEDVVIREVEVVSEDFHPIAHTESKIYHYKVHNAPLRDPFKDDVAWYVREPLDVAYMRETAKVFLGEHDFQSLCASGSTVRSTVRTVYSIDIDDRDPENLVFKFHGNGFLYNMIRILTAVLVRAGQGKMTITDAEAFLHAKDRSLVPWTAPAQGLYLMEIFYENQE